MLFFCSYLSFAKIGFEKLLGMSVCMVTYANPQLQLEGVLKQEVVPGEVLTSRLMD